jgi:hypothetical protein
MSKAETRQLVDARAQRCELGLVLGDLDLAVALETAVVVDQIADAVP